VVITAVGDAILVLVDPVVVSIADIDEIGTTIGIRIDETVTAIRQAILIDIDVIVGSRAPVILVRDVVMV
jgi:transcription antitermination factor NusA-like protein